MNKWFLLLLIAITNSAHSQFVNFEWVKSISGNNAETGISNTFDDAGNIYVTGYFTGTVDFDPSVFNYYLTSVGNSDIFILKLNRFGDFIWAKSIGGSGYDYGNSIAVDILGNVYTTGSFNNTVDFDPGPNYYNVTSAGLTDIFISKLDSLGNFLWTKTIGGIWTDEGASIKVDLNSNIFVTGAFCGFNSYVDFDPSSSISNLIGNGQRDVFISKFDGSGNFIWAKGFGGSGEDRPSKIFIDDISNIYVAGSFEGAVDFDPGLSINNLTSVGYSDVFISKFDGAGNFIWAKSFGGLNAEVGNSVTVDKNGNVYTVGGFYSTVDFDPSNLNYNITSAGLGDIFISKLNSAGCFVWAKSIGGSDLDFSTSIASDSVGGLYFAGSFGNTVDFDPNNSNFFLTSNGNWDFFISKLDSSGNFIWARSMGGSINDRCYSIAVNALGEIVTTGYFNNTVDFDPGAPVFNLISNGNYDVFIHKISQSTVDVSEIESHQIDVYPNPASDNLMFNSTVSNTENLTIHLRDALGQNIIKPILLNNINGHYFHTISTSEFPNGIYFLEIIGLEGRRTKKIIIDHN